MHVFFFMKVTHLYHSGVLVTLKHHQLLFDYYQGELLLDLNIPLYIIVSHSHYDHFNKDIFSINHPNITYILSDDIRKNYPATYVSANQTYQIDDLTIKTLTSTDQGVAYIVNVENKTIYHAGVLHWWHWIGEPDSDNEYQKNTYQSQINDIKETVDLAFVVVDTRLEDTYLWGLQYFLEHVKTKHIVPIHYFGDYSITNQLLNEQLNNPYHANIVTVHHKNETFLL